MRSSFATILAAFTIMSLAASCAGSASGDEASYPKPVKPCGAVRIAGRTMAVDIAEAAGTVFVGCSTARGAILRYLDEVRRQRLTTPGRNLTVLFRSRRYRCYTSRPDRRGWDYHCITFRENYTRYVDVGAGRRGKPSG